MQNKMGIRSKNAISFVDKSVMLYTIKSTLTTLLSTRPNLTAKADSENDSAKTFQPKQWQFSSFEKTDYTKQSEARTNVPHKSTDSIRTTSYCIYNI
jgi:hypothetical protein